MFGWAGRNLEIDLSLNKIDKSDTDATMNWKYLGGRGTACRIFWDRVPAETSPFSHDNLLILSTGVLTGTTAPTGNHTVIMTISPQTGYLTYSGIGGFWGPELKYAGFDRVVISGKAPAPIYIWINNDHVEIRDARHLWGKGVRETQRMIREELNNKRIQTLCIGPAGENKVCFASIEASSGSSASRTVGVVMGDKKIKAISVFGTKDIYIAAPSKFFKTCGHILEKSHRLKEYHSNWSYGNAARLINGGAYGNMGESIPIENSGKWHADFVEKLRSRKVSCFGCGLGCKSVMIHPNRNHSTVKCLSWFVFMFAAKIQDLGFNLQCYFLCEDYGLDSESTANVVGFAIDLYQRGILTEKDTDGLHLEWGKKDVVFSLIEKIVRREGIGDILAEGVYQAGKIIGKGAEEFAFHSKKLELGPYAMYTPSSALRSAITDRADATRVGSGILRNALKLGREWKEEYLKSGYFAYPKALEQSFIGETLGTENDYEEVIPFVSYDVDRYTLCDLSGLCIFWVGFWLYNPILPEDHFRLISYGTGMDIDETEATNIARRVGAATRSYNVMLGLRKKDDTVPSKFFRQPTSRRGLDPARFDEMLYVFYKMRGWNKEGIPSRKELDRLGLEDIRGELYRRGIL